MPHKPGAHLGGVRTLEDLRLRCVCRSGSDCWLYRNARGRRTPEGRTAKVWVYGHGAMPVTVAAWVLSGNERPTDGRRIGRTCDSIEDCIRHLDLMTPKQVMERASRLGRTKTPARCAALQATQRMRTKVPRWAYEMVRDKSKTAREWAAHWGCSASVINAIRSRESMRDGTA